MKNACKLTALILACIVFLSSCKGGTPSATTEGSSGTSSSQTVNVGNLDYTELECEDVGSFNYFNFVCGESVMAVNIPFPENWKLYKTAENIYVVKKYAKEIGKLYLGTESELDTGKTSVFSDTKEYLGIETLYSVNRYGEKGDYSYRRKIVFGYEDDVKERKVTLDIDYTAMNEKNLKFIRENSHMWEVITLPKFNTLSFENGNGSKAVMIVGNSFINTSRIDIILDELCTDEEISYVNGISVGNASIKDYAVRPYIMESIESGEYGMIFMCGLFSNDDIKALETVYNACKKSGTVLVLLPAYNEDRKRIKTAQEKYPDIVIVDWKNEIEQLINSGVNKWDLCVNDMHFHSTTLAGYVGANMIYRALFGEMPQKSVTQQISGISQSYVKNKLGEYLETGKICRAAKGTVYYFKENN